MQSPTPDVGVLPSPRSTAFLAMVERARRPSRRVEIITDGTTMDDAGGRRRSAWRR